MTRGRCEAVVSDRTRYWWTKFREGGESLHGKKVPLNGKVAVHMSYARPATVWK